MNAIIFLVKLFCQKKFLITFDNGEKHIIHSMGFPVVFCLLFSRDVEVKSKDPGMIVGVIWFAGLYGISFKISDQTLFSRILYIYFSPMKSNNPINIHNFIYPWNWIAGCPNIYASGEKNIKRWQKKNKKYFSNKKETFPIFILVLINFVG